MKKWILMFKRAGDSGNGIICQTVECREEELPGVKEKIALDLERNSGETWICKTIVPIPRKTS